MLSSNCEIVERAGRHVEVDRLVSAARGPTLPGHCNVNSGDRRAPDWHPSLPHATGLSVAVEPIRPACVKASEAADQFKDKADTAREKTSSQWQEMREHVSVPW
jgi:hypothetical protein